MPPKKEALKLDANINFGLKFITKNKQVYKTEKFKLMTNREVEISAFETIFNESIENGKIVSPKVIQTIKDADVTLKRMYLLTCLDRDRMLFKDIKEDLIKVKNGESIETISQKKDIVKKLRNYIEVGDVEKKAFGEVTTPIKLIEEMLDTLPVEVWSNPDLKWLDPCAGVGGFPAVIVERLMKGLENFEADEDLRYKHIIENMLYVCELQTKNVFIFLCAFDTYDKYETNIYNGSYLESGFDNHMKNEWGIDKFDIIIGNPPYNQTIDLKFLEKSYSIGDKILFVHPTTWLIDEKEIQNKFINAKNLIKNHLEKLIIFNGNKIFNIALFVPCGITYINKEYKGKIKVIDEINNVEIEYDNINQINKYSTMEYLSIKSKVEKHANIDNMWDRRNNESKYYVNLSQIRGNVSLNNQDFLVKDDFYTTITRDLEISETKDKHLAFGFETKDEATNFLNYNKTFFLRFCLSIYKNNSQLSRGELAIIPYLDFKQGWNDEKLYKYFNLTEDEIKFIETVIPSYY